MVWKRASLSLLFGTAFIATSAAKAGNPTHWTFERHRALPKDRTIILECQGTAAGLPNKIPLRLLIGPYIDTKEHIWHGFDNDGLGLNEAKWVCAASNQSPHPLSDSAISTTFSTQWGEDARFVVRVYRGQLAVTKGG